MAGSFNMTVEIPATINTQAEPLRVVEAVSPTATVEENDGGALITIHDLHGTTTAQINNGATGPQGERGEQGPQGIQGMQGERGEKGTQGEKGDKGDKGDTGDPGPKGDTGAQGIQGPKGDKGDKGDTGEQGIQGIQGLKGDTGEQGPKGDTGATGPAGTDGISPTISVTDITGGHRVTITDATGAHSFDVMDGDAADAPVQDVQVNGTSVLSNGVANVPVATQTTLGVAKGYGSFGINMDAYGNISLDVADNAKVKAGTSIGSAISPGRQHLATFYGLAKAAGDTTQSASSNAVGTYTDAAKSAISQMLNGSVAITGTTPTITALPGVRYVCGEVATLDITLPASGIVDVVFESGSTPTVLTITPPTGVTLKWANGFDPTSLEANTTYEINILDGKFGVVGSWT